MTNLNANNMKLPAEEKSTVRHALQLQCLRILRCTAKAMASTPGGLRFKAGTRPWLEGLEGRAASQPAQAVCFSRQ
jgi:hypothetical protein